MPDLLLGPDTLPVLRAQAQAVTGDTLAWRLLVLAACSDRPCEPRWRCGPASATLLPGARQQIAQEHPALEVGGMCFVEHAHRPAAVALDAQEPGREGAERLGERLLSREQRVVSVQWRRAGVTTWANQGRSLRR